MAEDKGKRRRGRRRGGRQEEHHEPAPRQEQASTDEPQVDELQVTEESDAPGVTSTRPSISGGSRRERKSREKERAGAAAGGAGVSPMDFWRSGSARSYRDRPAGGGGKGPGVFQRLTNFYFPPWAPVVLIIFVVFGILALLFITRSATGAPRIGRDHWHATYEYYVCGDRQPPAPFWNAGVHTHDDGIIHIHPHSQSEEGAGARLVKWFEYGGGVLTDDQVRLPGQRTTYENGDECQDGTPGEVQVFVNGLKMDDFSRYIPRDGDHVRIVFGPPQDEIHLDDRTIISQAQATRTINMQVIGEEPNTAFVPASIEIDAGETVMIQLRNDSEVSHGFRIAGMDGEYNTADDFVITPMDEDPNETAGLLQPGEEGFVVVRFDRAGRYEFQDPTDPNGTGTIIVRPSAAAQPEPEEEEREEVDAEYDLIMTGDSFEPAELRVRAGERFRINLINEDGYVHNLRIDGPDGQFRTEDDILSADVLPGETGELVAQIDEPGTYQFRDDFPRIQMTGTLIVE